MLLYFDPALLQIMEDVFVLRGMTPLAASTRAAALLPAARRVVEQVMSPEQLKNPATLPDSAALALKVWTETK